MIKFCTWKKTELPRENGILFWFKLGAYWFTRKTSKNLWKEQL